MKTYVNFTADGVDQIGSDAWYILDSRSSQTTQIRDAVVRLHNRRSVHTDFNGFKLLRGDKPSTAIVFYTSKIYTGLELSEFILGPRLAHDHPTFLRRLAKAINRECAMNGFYSSFGAPLMTAGGQRKFHGHVIIRKGRLLAREVGSDDYLIDITGVTEVNGNGNGVVSASDYVKYPHG